MGTDVDGGQTGQLTHTVVLDLEGDGDFVVVGVDLCLMDARRERDRVSTVDGKGLRGTAVCRSDVVAETTYDVADASAGEWPVCEDLERLLELNAVKG